VTVGGPALYLLGESAFRLRMIQSVNPKRIATIVVVLALALIGRHVPALVLGAAVAAVLSLLAVWEYEAPAARATRAASRP